MPTTTAGVLVETSVGSFTVDLFGADCPSATGNFINLCRCCLWNGAVATAIIPDAVVFFSHEADPIYAAALESLGAVPSTSPPATPGPRVSNSFWSLLRASTAALPDGQPSSVAQEAAQQAAAQKEMSSSKRLSCRSITWSRNGEGGAVHRDLVDDGQAGTSVGCLGRKGLIIVEPTHSERSPDGATRFHFGVTLSERNLDFLEGQYLAIGVVSEGASVLDRIRAAPYRDLVRDGGGKVPPRKRWPRPIRLLRIKHTTVLPTAGTEPYGIPAMRSGLLEGDPRSREELGRALSKAGCFAYWAPARSVREVNRVLVQAVARVAKDYAAASEQADGPADQVPMTVQGPLVVLPEKWRSSLHNGLVVSARTGGDDDDDVCSLEYNPHCSGGYLSSDDELADDEASSATTNANGGTRSSGGTRALEARRQAATQLHQERVNTTLSLMLNVLNGIADADGELKPPENVLFVCRLNPATTGEGLAMCFAQFGKIISADVIEDRVTKQSLGYGFVEFDTVDACFRAMRKMDQALVDDSRIHVDFSQSVSKLWAQRRRELRKRPRPVGGA